MMRNNRFLAAAAALLALAVLAAPCQAMTMSDNGAARAQGSLAQGVIEQADAASLLIDGRRYAVSPATTAYYDRSGKPASGARPAAGQTVAFRFVQEGSQTRIKELWIVK
jgi:hypothetical protein